MRDAAHIESVGVLSTFHLVPRSGVWDRRGELGVEPADALEERWETPDGNTLSRRLGRAARALALCEKIGVPVEQTNYHVDRAAHEAARRGRRTGSSLHLGECSLAFKEGRAVFRIRQRDITRGRGMRFAVLLPGEEPFRSPEADWDEDLRGEGGRIFSVARWGDNHFFVWQSFDGPDEDRVLWRLVLQTDDTVAVEGFRAQMPLNRNYTRTMTPAVAVSIPPLVEAGGSANTVFETSLPAEIELGEAVGEDLPVLAVRADAEGLPFRAVLTAGDEPELAFHLDEPRRFPPGTHQILAAELAARRQAAEHGPRPLVAESAGLRLEIMDGAVHLFIDGVRVTDHDGLIVDLDIPDGGRFVSPLAEWTCTWARDAADEAVASLRWGPGDPVVWQTFRLNGGALEWEGYLVLRKELDLVRIKAGAVLSSGYTAWRCGAGGGSFPEPAEGESWDVLGPHDPAGVPPLADGYAPGAAAWIGVSGEGLPSLVLGRDPDSDLHLPAVQAGCGPGVSVGYYAAGPYRHQFGVRLLFRYRLGPGQSGRGIS